MRLHLLHLSGNAPVRSGGLNGITNALTFFSSADAVGARVKVGSTAPYNLQQENLVGNGFATFGPAGTPVAGLYADLSTATAATINAIRTAFQVQRHAIVTGKQIGRAHV